MADLVIKIAFATAILAATAAKAEVITKDKAYFFWLLNRFRRRMRSAVCHIGIGEICEQRREVERLHGAKNRNSSGQGRR